MFRILLYLLLFNSIVLSALLCFVRLWQKEQEALRQSTSDNVANSYGVEAASTKPAKTLDKQQKIRLFELRKDLGKLDKKIA